VSVSGCHRPDFYLMHRDGSVTMMDVQLCVDTDYDPALVGKRVQKGRNGGACGVSPWPLISHHGALSGLLLRCRRTKYDRPFSLTDSHCNRSLSLKRYICSDHTSILAKEASKLLEKEASNLLEYFFNE